MPLSLNDNHVMPVTLDGRTRFATGVGVYASRDRFSCR
jgi:hypothetical protein